MQFLNDILNIFYPDVCLGCGDVILSSESILCTKCVFDLPLSNYIAENNNAIEKVFYGRIKIEQATALLLYQKNSISQLLIHNLKYKNHEEIGVFLGKWLGKEIINHQIFKNIDYIVPVPLHKNRLKKRGYNQVTKFGIELSNYLKTSYIENILIRKSASSSQTKKTRLERLTNVEELFFLTDNQFFYGKHVLLIDDIITTGATIEACANELFKTKNIKISIAVMAFTE